MRTQKVALVILLIFVIGTVAPAPLAPREAGLTRPFLPTPIRASEEETIDTFNVHPANRWTIDETGYTVTVANSILNMSDTGDWTNDYYLMRRNLASTDDKIQVLFKYEISGDSNGGVNDQFNIYLIGGAAIDAGTDYFGLQVHTPQDADYSTTAFAYTGITSTQSKAMSGTERIYEDLWYLLSLDFDLLRSTADIKLEFVNGTDVFDYEWSDLSTDPPKLFSYENMHLYIRSHMRGTETMNTYWNYVDAPFKENTWQQLKGPSDADYLEDNWDGMHVQDDIDEDSKWNLVVPRFDSMSGSMMGRWSTDTGPFTSDDRLEWGIIVQEVTPSTGAVTWLLAIDVVLRYSSGAGMVVEYYIFGDTILDQRVYKVQYDAASPFTFHPKVTFSFLVNDNRHNISLRSRLYPDAEDSTNFEEFYASNNVNHPAEFIIQTVYSPTFTGDYLGTVVVEDFSFSSRDIFEGIARALGIVDLIIGAVVWVFTQIGLWLGAIFKWAIDGLGAFLADPLAFLADIFELIGDIIVNFLAAIQGWLPDFFGWLADTVVEILGFFAAILFYAYDNFLPWGGYPPIDFIALFVGLLGYVVSFASWLIATVTNVTSWLTNMSWSILVIWWFYALFLQFARAGFNPAEGTANFIDAFFKNLVPIAIFGFQPYVPQGLFFLAWLLLLIPADVPIFPS